ncbi:DoxX family membrane protein [Streptomyces litchfieldiae]|uniref:DoxX family membrane protein n=1 Tax=Streptomyces litchfieldiae TaxID=3075543 RepID=A0ABU2MNZ3_9ACTN|nr:DoxX family membrane protein [Streptomyces sp. DSM 44938]MDT0343331.1 DoxX family membrane protein [Streptomyces sp. DSM 44938]
MSVDTRTPRGLTMDEPVLNTVKVPCDPAQVIVNHASFRVQLATPPPVSIAVPPTGPLPRVPAAARRRPLVWSGRSAPGDAGAGTLIRAVREAGHAPVAGGGDTRVLPRVATERAPAPVVSPRRPQPPERAGTPPTAARPPAEEPRERPRPAVHDGRQAYHPGRHLSLGVVLLPLRLLLGFVAIYAGMGKLTDPVYFDGGERGSLNAWLSSLQPWSVAAPLHDWALAHPVGAGLSVAFTQIIVGVLTVFGLWQRLAAGLGALLSLALLVTVSWGHGPAYDTPDLLLCAAWSPLVIAGAPVYSLDARLAGEAWRTLGPRAPLSDLRHRVLRRGAALATLLLGLALLIGSLLGSAVRSAQFPTVPEPGQPPRNHLPGEPLPGETEKGDERAEDRPADGAGAEETPRTPNDPAEDAAPDRREPDDAGEPSAEDTREAESPSAERTVPAPQQPAEPAPRSPAEQQGQQPAPAPAAPDAGDAAEPAEESAPAEEGGEESSLSPIGGLLG